jgi:hypothetical protein
MVESKAIESDFIVLYGTQTNTAKHAAEELGREAIKRKVMPSIMEFDEFQITKLPK